MKLGSTTQQKQSKQWALKGEPTPKKAKAIPSAIKVIATVSWGASRTTSIDYLKKEKAINANKKICELCVLIAKFERSSKKKHLHLAKKKVLDISHCDGQNIQIQVRIASTPTTLIKFSPV